MLSPSRRTCSYLRRGLCAAALPIAPMRWPRCRRPARQLRRFRDPVFKALLVDGSTVSGRIMSLGPGAIKLASGEGPARELPLGRLIKLTRESSVAFPSLDRSHVIFPEGDCLMRAVVGSSTETTLDVRSDALGKMAIPLESMLGLVSRRPAV